MHLHLHDKDNPVSAPGHVPSCHILYQAQQLVRNPSNWKAVFSDCLSWHPRWEDCRGQSHRRSREDRREGWMHHYVAWLFLTCFWILNVCWLPRLKTHVAVAVDIYVCSCSRIDTSLSCPCPCPCPCQVASVLRLSVSLCVCGCACAWCLCLYCACLWVSLSVCAFILPCVIPSLKCSASPFLPDILFLIL